jgi:membrane protein DedA with SNARE-associated domain
VFDIITSILASLGGFGVFLLMLAENVFPPIPSEVILPLAGYTAAQGRGSLWVVAIAGTLGSAAGAVLWYYVGRWIGIERLKRFASRHGRWLTLTPGEVDHVDRWFDRYGRWAVLFGRMVPGPDPDFGARRGQRDAPWSILGLDAHRLGHMDRYPRAGGL